MTVGGHFERVAARYESLRTTDVAPVRTISQLLPGRPVAGLDIGCGTGRYTRLLRAVLPDGSRLAASDVSAAMLAQLKAASQRHTDEVAPLRAAAEELPLRAASLDLVTAFNCVHHFDLGRFLAAAARVLAPGGPLFIYTRSRTRARSGAATSPVSPSTSSACTARTRSGTPSGGPAGSRWPPHRPSTTRAPARPSGSGPRPRADPPQELRAAIATFLASLPGPEVSWMDEHLLVIADRRRNQAQPDGPASPANQTVTGQARQISAKRAGQAPPRRPGGRAQATP